MTLLRAATLVLLPTLTVSAVLLTGSAEPLQAAAKALPQKPTARLAGVMINPRIIEGDDENGFPALAFQGTMSETKLALVVELDAGGIIGLDREQSEVTKLSDDLGRSLLDPNSPFSAFGFGERVLDGGRRLVLEIEGKNAPSPVATALAAHGVLAVRVAHEQRTVASEAAEWKKGRSIASGPFGFAVEDSGEAEWGGGYELELQTQSDLTPIVSYIAVLSDGARVELDQRSTMTFGNTTRISLHSEVPLEAGQLEVTYWHDSKLSRVPFQVSATVGFK